MPSSINLAVFTFGSEVLRQMVHNGFPIKGRQGDSSLLRHLLDLPEQIFRGTKCNLR